MLTRRRFLKIFGFASLAFSLLPNFLVRKSFSSSMKEKDNPSKVRNWLYGYPRRGCSTLNFAMEYHGKMEDDLKDFVSLNVTPNLAQRIPHEQYLS